MFSAVTKYNFFNKSNFRWPPLLPQYRGAGSKSFANGVMGSLPNIKMNGDSPVDWQGKKLYAAATNGTTSSHSAAFLGRVWPHRI